jgi:hypothetical protein
MFKPGNLYGTVGVMLFLIALYLVLEKAAGASNVITSVGASSSQVFKTLQGRG